MNEAQKKAISHFLDRPLMYLYKIEKEQIVAFIHGFEIGNNPQFTDELSNLLENKYKIKRRALGWPFQVQKFSEIKSLDWFDAFKLLSNELINN
jgi:hypothetical protein